MFEFGFELAVVASQNCGSKQTSIIKSVSYGVLETLHMKYSILSSPLMFL